MVIVNDEGELLHILTPTLPDALSRFRRNVGVVYGAHKAPTVSGNKTRTSADHLEVSTSRPPHEKRRYQMDWTSVTVERGKQLQLVNAHLLILHFA